jgi:hypothetical protein
LRSQLHQLGPMIAQLVLSGTKARALVAWELEGVARSQTGSAAPPPGSQPSPCPHLKSVQTLAQSAPAAGPHHGAARAPWHQGTGPHGLGARGAGNTSECGSIAFLCFSYFSSSYFDARESVGVLVGAARWSTCYSSGPPQPLQTVS